ncbi:MAG: GxxExxY protein [Magnetovibrionaceae bacterium]
MQTAASPAQNTKDPLTSQIIGLAIEVHRELGPGLLESAYEECLARELTNASLGFERQKQIPVHYKGEPVTPGFRVDLLVENEVVVELKAVEKLLPIHEAQVLTYLKLGGFPTGLIMNFHAMPLKSGIKRLVV